MRLPDGRLCVIDFGLMAEIEKSEMDAMVSAIVHLANRDWPRVVEDFVALCFLPGDVDTSEELLFVLESYCSHIPTLYLIYQ